jgi:hypothetical protein
MRSVIGVTATHSILDNAEFLEALAQTVVVCVPGKTARKGQSARGMLDILLDRPYPMKSFDILMEMGRDGEMERGGKGVSVKRGTAEPDLKYNPGRNNITPQIPDSSFFRPIYFSTF